LEALRSLEIGIRAVRTQRQALHTIGHNIANVNTPGFSRQRAILSTTLPQGSMGTGVKVQAIQRVRDEIVDFYIRKETSTLNQWKAKFENLQQVEILFNEPSENGIASILNDFWDSWADLANNPESGAARANVKQQAKTLSQAFNGLYKNLKDFQNNIDNQIKAEVEHLNTLIQQIGNLNQEIEKVELGGMENANDLRDRRDLLIDELSGLLNFSSQEMKDSTVRVSVYGQLLISKTKVAELTTEAGESGYLDIRWKDNKEKVYISDGKLKGLIDTRDVIIPEFLEKLNNLASGLIQEVNELHQQGMGLDGTSEIKGWKNFIGALDEDGSFEINGIKIDVAAGDDLDTIITKINAKANDTGVEASKEDNKLVLKPYSLNPKTICITADPDGIMLEKLGILTNFFKGKGAEDIDVSDAVMQDLNKIAASQSGAPGDNSNALKIGDLREKLTMDNQTCSFADYYSGIIGKLGVETKQASRLKENQDILLNQLEDRRQSICGVSLDEEMTNIILFQQAYRVAVSFLKTVDTMLDILTTTMGV